MVFCRYRSSHLSDLSHTIFCLTMWVPFLSNIKASDLLRPFPSPFYTCFVSASTYQTVFYAFSFPFPNFQPLNSQHVVGRNSSWNSSFLSIVLCAKLHISDLEWKDLLLDHGQRISYFDWLHSMLQLGAALGCSWGEAVGLHWRIICALEVCRLSLCRDTSAPKLQCQWCILGAAVIHDAGEDVLTKMNCFLQNTLALVSMPAQIQSDLWLPGRGSFVWVQEQLVDQAVLPFSSVSSLPLKANQGKSKLRDELWHLCSPKGQGQHWSFLGDA